MAYSGTNLLTATASSVVNVTTNTNVTQKVSLSAVNFGPCVTTFSGTGQLSVGSGGLILNGGTLTGGSLSFAGVTPYLYAGSNVPSRISSALEGDWGLVKFGAGSLILAGNNSGLSGAIAVTAGTLSAQNFAALGAGGAGSPVNLSAGACLALQNNISVGNVPITINGSGPSGGGALWNVQDNNTLAGAISLGSNSQINVQRRVVADRPCTGQLQPDQERQRDAGSGRGQRQLRFPH